MNRIKATIHEYFMVPLGLGVPVHKVFAKWNLRRDSECNSYCCGGGPGLVALIVLLIISLCILR